jgi:hypothetical protein
MKSVRLNGRDVTDLPLEVTDGIVGPRGARREG